MIGTLLDDAKRLAIVAPEYQDGVGKGLEAEVVFAVAKAVKDAGFPVIARNHRGEAINGRFVLRGGPGNFDLPTDAQGCCYFDLIFNGDQVFELHNSLELLGRSRETHEMDVCVLWGVDADAARAGRQRALSGPPVVGIEVKEFGLRTPVSKNIARAFFACVLDFIPSWALEAQTIREIIAVAQLGPPELAVDRFWILSTGRASDETKRFLKAYAIDLIDQLDQAKLKAAAGRVVGLLNSWAAWRGRDPAAPKALTVGRRPVSLRPLRKISPVSAGASIVRIRRPRRLLDLGD